MGNTMYDQNTWASDEDNLHMSELKNMKISFKNASLVDDLVAAVRSFGHRICPSLMLQPTNAIVDSLADVSADIANVVAFVAKQAADKNTTCPFHFDVIFAFNEVKDASDVSKDRLTDFKNVWTLNRGLPARKPYQ